MANQLPFASNIPLRDLVKNHKLGKPVGIYSICSSNQAALQAAMQLHRESGSMLLIESTCNQVNQDGGYTGMTPAKFAGYIKTLANEIGFPEEKVILGGDHLGPNPWKHESAEVAMRKAEELVRAYVTAGFIKIHLDASMPCQDDENLSAEEIARRTARMALQSENASQTYPDQNKPLYVIGTEVPAPGGLAAGNNQAVHISSVEDVEETIYVHRKELAKIGLEDMLPRIIAVVVSPGVEFGDHEVFPYERKKAGELKGFIEREQDLVFEAHSTDYQPMRLLREMVEDHFAILKVGPALTFAFREAIFRLAAIEEDMPGLDRAERSDLLNVIRTVMRDNPQHWQNHYSGSEDQIEYSLKYSYSDRIRYYWGFPEIKDAMRILLRNLRDNKIPGALLSQFFPSLYVETREKQEEIDPGDLIKTCITRVLQDYQSACGI